jgi:pimeloyl-ACP methyl ester carboxylesterase
MQTAPANGIDVAYERSGEGPHLLFVGGSGQTLATSAPMVQPFASSFDVVVFDQRGLGASSKPPGPYTMADYAADAAGLLDHLGWQSARVAGVSFGGMVAQELAVTWPERIERLALLCTSAGGAGGASYPLHELEALLPGERAERATELLDTRFTPSWLDEHPNDRALADFILQRESEERSPEEQRGMSEQLAARSKHDVFDRLPRITCPTLVACGRFDGIAPPANGAAIAGQISGAEVRVYDGGHAFFVQDPSAYTDVQAFLGGDGPGG